MELKTSYINTEFAPVYAGSAAVASVTEDGMIFATPMMDSVKIFKKLPCENSEAQRFELLHVVENNDEQDITALRLTPDGQYLAYISQAQLLKIFKLKTGEIVRSMKISSPSYVVDSDPTSTLLAVGGTDGSITVIDIANGYVTHSFKGHGGTISSLKFFGEAGSNVWLLVSGDTNGVVKVWDLVKRRCLHTMQEHTSAVRGLDLNMIGDTEEIQLISGGRDDIVNLWTFNLLKKVKLIKTVPVHQQVESCGFIRNADNNNSYIYTAGGDAIIQVVSLQTGKVMKKSEKPVEELFISGALPILNHSHLYLVLSDQTLQLVNLPKIFESEKDLIDIDESIAGNNGTIAGMKVVGPNLNMLALATNSPALRVIPLNEKNEENILTLTVDLYQGHSDLLNSLDATEDGLWIATASKDNTAILWRYGDKINKFSAYARFSGHVSAVTAVGLPHVMNNNWPEFIITASNDLTIKKWKVPKPTDNSTLDQIHEIKSSDYTRRAHEKDINALSIAPNDSVFATASYDKTCKVWDLESGELQSTLSNHKRGLWDVSFCQYDKFLATASGDKTVKIWSLETSTVIKTLEGHTNAVQACSFINKQKQLVSTGADGLIKIWDCSTGECLGTLDGHDNRIWALDVIGDGKKLITADADGVFQFWKDCTEETRIEDLQKEKEKVEQMQSLQNFIAQKDWTNAFLLAITLDHPMRLYNVLRQSAYSQTDDAVPEEEKGKYVFNKDIDHLISTLSDEQLLLLMKRCRDWNTNARTHDVAQKAIRSVLMTHNIAKLSEVTGIMNVINGILPYTQRHFARLDDLKEQSYILEYALVEMDKLL